MWLCHCCPVKSCQADEKAHCMRLSQKEKNCRTYPARKRKKNHRNELPDEIQRKQVSGCKSRMQCGYAVAALCKRRKEMQRRIYVPLAENK
jgi:hypothetical protein